MLNWRVAQGIRVDLALAEIEAQPDLWNLFTGRQDYHGSAHRDTQSIILRGPVDYKIETVFDELHGQDNPSLIARLPWTTHLINLVCQKHLPGWFLGRVMIVKLKPNGHIAKHWDMGAYAAHYDRFHLILTSAAGNFIKTWATRPASFISPFPGELIKFPHLADHEVWNISDEPRIHIIIDARKP